MVDSTGTDVGVVTSLSTYYGSATASVLRELTLPGSSGPESFVFAVDSSGFRKNAYGSYFEYASSDCTGSPFQAVDCQYGACAGPAPLAFFASVQPDGTTATFVRLSEVQHQQYYSRQTLSSSAGGAFLETDCTQGSLFHPPGVVLGPAHSCPSEPSPVLCLDCCIPGSTPRFPNPQPTPSDAAPVHAIDVSQFGLTPPFRLKR